MIAPNESISHALEHASHAPAKRELIPAGDNWARENQGHIVFDYRRFNGTYHFGFGDSMFITQWTESGEGSIWAYGEADESIVGVALLQRFYDLGTYNIATLDKVRFDFTSTRQNVLEGDAVLFRKETNLVLHVIVENVHIRADEENQATELICNYQIVQWDTLPTVARTK